MDEALALIVAPRLSTGHSCDEDELELAVSKGVYDAPDAQRLIAAFAAPGSLQDSSPDQTFNV